MKKFNMIRNESLPLKIVFSLIASLLIKILLIIVSSYILTKNDISPDKIYLFWFGICIINALISGFMAGKIFRKRGIVWGAVIGFLSASVTILILMIYSSFTFNILLIPLFFGEAIFSAAAGIISTNLRA